MEVKVTPFSESPGADPAFGTAPRRRRSRFRRRGFWSAVAGMAVAIAIACAVVAMEMAGEFDARASHFRHRADQLQARLGRIEQRLTMADHEVTEMRRQAEVRERFNRILAAPDGQLVRLEAPDRRGLIHGALAFSPRLAQAVLEVTGLPQGDGQQRFALRWIRRQGAPSLAAEFAARDPGQPDVVVEVAPPPPEVTAMVVDPASPAASSGKAVASPLLRGELRKTAKR
ncbi:MAG: hypothetical protein ACLQBA_22515 [Candidatus Binataceae bacterium]